MKTITKLCGGILAVALTTSGTTFTLAQQSDDELYALSIEELMQIPIESASKKEETLFKAPLASHTITAKEIANAGVNSIPEALRLAPGMIVRQQTNGVYDVQIRGLDNLIRGNAIANTNRTTLVMINNRPVFNHNLGGTFWESLPIGVSDIDRIEIVRGPAASLFGPNAVTGVINIITKQADKENIQASVHAEIGDQNNNNISTYLSKRVSDKFSLFVSGNYKTGDRFTQEFVLSSDGSTGSISELPEETRATLNGNRSIERKGINAGLSFNPSKDLSMDLSFGHQDNDALKNFLQNNGLGLGWTQSNSNYINLNTRYRGFTMRNSYWKGKENTSVNAAPGNYDFNILESVAEYEIKIGDLGTVIPGLGYTRAVYSDADYSSLEPKLLQGSPEIETRSASVRTDWNLSDQWRLIAAMRFDSFTSHDDIYMAYQLASTYEFGENHFLRASISRSNNGSFIGNNFANSNSTSILQGNTNLKLLTVRSIELGYRVQISPKIQLDVDLFRQKAKNPNTLRLISFSPLGQPIIAVSSSEIEAVQTGITLSANIVANNKFQIKPFVTYQNTDVENVPSSSLGDFDPGLRNISGRHEQTPDIVGGWYLSYNALSKLNISLTGYFHSSQTFYNYSLTPEFEAEYNGKFLVNMNISYNVRPWATVFVNVDNIFEDDTREFINTERIGRYMGTGIRVNFNN